MIRRRSSALCLQSLERRDAPATRLGLTQLRYQDFDGDTVTVTFSKPILADNTVANAVFQFDSGPGAVNDNLGTKEQLWAIDLTSLAVPADATGTSITVTAVRDSVNQGDGFAAVGEINATGIDLAIVTIDGDLGKLVAGDPANPASAVKSLTVQSMGVFGTTTGAGTTTLAVDLHSTIRGKLDLLRVKSDMKEALVDVQGGADGKIGSVFIGGSLIGGSVAQSGRLAATGGMGLVTIKGNIVGGSNTDAGSIRADVSLAGVKVGGSVIGGEGNRSGRIRCFGDMGFVTVMGNLTGSVVSSGKLAGVKVGGSVIGGAANNSGWISSDGDLGLVTIVGNLTGSAEGSGQVFSGGKLAGASVSGSVQGGVGYQSGAILSVDNMGLVSIRGDLTGGVGSSSGAVSTGSKLAGVRVGGSVVGGGSDSGVIFAEGDAGTIAIGRDLIGGSASGTADLSQSGFIRAKRIASLTLGGSLMAGTDNTSGTFSDNGAIRVVDDLGAVLIKGSIIGNSTNRANITARGRATPTATSDAAIGSLRVLGNVEFARILAGFDLLIAGAGNADAQIGTVFVGGDWIASSIAAGATPGPTGYGDGDAKMSGINVKDDSLVFSRIASLTIGGQALGTTTLGVHFGIVAENVGALKIGGTTIPLAAGRSNDDFFVGITGDFKVHEI